jgi:RecA-family ATPase
MTDDKRVWKGIPRFDLEKVKDSKALIDKFLWEATLQLCYGQPGTRKTTLLLKAGWCVSQGIPFADRKTRRRTVLYLDYENPDHGMKTFCQDLKIDPSNPWFAIWDRSAGEVPRPAGEGKEKLDDFIRRCQEERGHSPWLIFDSMTSLLREGESGNALGEITETYRALRAYCDIGVTSTIIDHTGNRSKRSPIGSSGKMSQMDTAHLFTQHTPDSLNPKTSTTTIRVENYLKRFCPPGEGTFSLEVKCDKDAKDVWHTTSIETTKDIDEINREKDIANLKSLIKKNPNLSQSDLAELAKSKELMSRNQAVRYLQGGEGKYWKSLKKRNNKSVFKVIA